ncbi:proteasome activator subunit 4-like isoform X1 [Arachis hypogaea]|uniref:proteasome activator subunit 4-like isoform X1 n=1 Tax=Arachis hypogaea TaxID=3818 RepID=UPI003B212822
MIPSWKSGSLLSNRSVQDLKSFSSFIMAILLSFFRISDKDNHTCGLGFSDLVSQIGSMSFDSTGLHWRPLFEEFEKSTFSNKDTCNFGFEYTLKKITVQAVTW